ncbi:hypothetical protein [Paenibacillus sp. LjRoot56]
MANLRAKRGRKADKLSGKRAESRVKRTEKTKASGVGRLKVEQKLVAG